MKKLNLFVSVLSLVLVFYFFTKFTRVVKQSNTQEHLEVSTHVDIDPAFEHIKMIRELKEKFRKAKKPVLSGMANKHTSISAFLSVYPIGGRFFSFWNARLEKFKLSDKEAERLKKDAYAFAKPFEEGNISDRELYSFLNDVFFKSSRLNRLMKKSDPTFAGFTKEDVVDYMEIIKKMHEKEKEFVGHNVFYHGHTNNITFLFDMITEIRSWIELKSGQTINLRLKKLLSSNNPQVVIENIKQYIEYWYSVFKIKDWDSQKVKVYNDWSDVLRAIDPNRYGTLEGYAENNWEPIRGMGRTMMFPVFGTWLDNIEPLKSQVFCVNFCPFAFLHRFGENSLAYFITDKSIKAPDWIDGIFLELGMGKAYIERLKKVFNTYMKPKKGGQIIQIFIPKDKVDKFVYISGRMGIPIMPKINWVSYDERLGYHTKTSDFLDLYLNDPSFLILEKDLPYLEKVDNVSDYSLLSKIYSFEVMNEHQGRIVSLPGFFDQENGVQTVRYNFVSEANKKAYRKEFREIVEKMMRDWIVYKRYREALGDDVENKRLVRLLDFIKRGQKEREEQVKRVQQEAKV